LPYWMDLTEQEMLGFFKDVYTAAPDIPLIHYNIPRAKAFLTGPDYVKVQEVAPSLVGVKYTFAGSHFGELQVAQQLTPDLSYFVAENFLVSAMMLGAQGVYSSLVCTNPNFMLKVWETAEKRDWEEALKLQEHIVKFFLDLHEVMAAQGVGGMDPVVDKGMAVASGLFAGHQRTRPPYIGWPDHVVAAIREFLIDRYPELVAPAFD